MTATDIDDVEEPKKSKLPLMIGLVLMLAGGAAGFFAVGAGLLPLGTVSGESAKNQTASEGDKANSSATPGKVDSGGFGFVPMEPIIVNLPSAEGRVYLRFSAQLEVTAGQEANVAALMPRIVDVLNGYLRALQVSELEDPTLLARLRGQMLRRVQIVAGADAVRDLLVMEFVLN